MECRWQKRHLLDRCENIEAFTANVGTGESSLMLSPTRVLIRWHAEDHPPSTQTLTFERFTYTPFVWNTFRCMDGLDGMMSHFVCSKSGRKRPVSAPDTYTFVLPSADCAIVENPVSVQVEVSGGGHVLVKTRTGVTLVTRAAPKPTVTVMPAPALRQADYRLHDEVDFHLLPVSGTVVATRSDPYILMGVVWKNGGWRNGFCSSLLHADVVACPIRPTCVLFLRTPEFVSDAFYVQIQVYDVEAGRFLDEEPVTALESALTDVFAGAHTDTQKFTLRFLEENIIHVHDGTLHVVAHVNHGILTHSVVGGSTAYVNRAVLELLKSQKLRFAWIAACVR